MLIKGFFIIFCVSNRFKFFSPTKMVSFGKGPGSGLFSSNFLHRA
jgi:hypothetical protein